MNIWPLTLALAMILSCLFAMVGGNVVVKQINVGRYVELPCLSNDDDHRFMFWQMSDEKSVVGPGNSIDTNKYNYDVLTGKLGIKSVSTAESGFYKCISRGLIDNAAINIRAVELIVVRDWEDLWENDFETNLLRSLAAVMVIVVTIAVVLYIVTNKKTKNSKYFDIDDSRENSPADFRDVPQASARVVRSSSSPIVEIGIDNSALDVDFPKVFTQMHQEQAIGRP